MNAARYLWPAITGALLAAWLVRENMAQLPRGYRNNNPGNIRGSDQYQWQGQVGTDAQGFVRFENMAYGFRALAVLLRNYGRLHGIASVRGVIERYAPAVENNTGAYVEHVAQRLGVAPDDYLDLSDQRILGELAAVIAHHENGQTLASNEADIEAGLALV